MRKDICQMTEKWTGNCKAQEVLQQLFDEGKIKGDSTPAYVRSLDLDTFNQYSDAVFNLHLRKTKIANSTTNFKFNDSALLWIGLKNTAKRGKQISSLVSFHDQIECPQLGKRKIEQGTGHVDDESIAHEDLQNPGYLVCDYFDLKKKETFVGVAVCLMWGMKSCKIEVYCPPIPRLPLCPTNGPLDRKILRTNLSSSWWGQRTKTEFSQRCKHLRTLWTNNEINYAKYPQVLNALICPSKWFLKLSISMLVKRSWMPMSSSSSLLLLQSSLARTSCRFKLRYWVI